MPGRESTPFFSGCLRERSGGNIAPACRACVHRISRRNQPGYRSSDSPSLQPHIQVGPASPTDGPQGELLCVYPEFAVHDLKPKPSQKVRPLAIR
jgi:hypothetical protein